MAALAMHGAYASGGPLAAARSLRGSSSSPSLLADTPTSTASRGLRSGGRPRSGALGEFSPASPARLGSGGQGAGRRPPSTSSSDFASRFAGGSLASTVASDRGGFARHAGVAKASPTSSRAGDESKGSEVWQAMAWPDRFGEPVPFPPKG
mmetsp:Transcript_102133/g.288448  ORF Transcript_102133/g.288448 Transcript_102133/m.288448 type:complete len:151 (-) Transcript_102133:122-574(-)